jgi:hypothetical protein
MNVNQVSPGRDLYNLVRAGFVSQGSSLSAWCKNQGISRANAVHCLVGSWNGPKGQALRKQLVVDAGIYGPSKAA